MGRLARFIHFYTEPDDSGPPGPPPVEKTVSGAIVHILDALARPAISLVCEINPVQDLHGYENPWPAGGGANIFDEVVEVGAINSSTGEDVDATNRLRTTNYIPVEPEKAYCFILPWTHIYAYDSSKQFVAYGQSNNASPLYFPVCTDDANIHPRTWTVPSGVYYLRFAFTTTYGTTYKNDCGIMYPPSVTTYSPYSNICPITGFTGLTVQHTGKNLLDLDRTVGTPNPSTGGNTTSPRELDVTKYYVGLRSDNYYYPQYVTAYTFENDEISVSTGNNNSYGLAFPVSVKGNTAYTVNVEATNPIISTGFYDSAWNYIGDSGASIANTHTFTTPENAKYAVIVFRAKANDTSTYKKIQLELGSTATAYSPYQGETIPISWQTEAGTVYAGEINLITGELITKPYYESYNGETLTGHWISSMDAYAEGTTPTIGAEVVNDGAEGTTYQLDPIAVNLLLGENNLWHDANGNTELTYYADGTASTQEALGILLGGAYHNPGGNDDATDDEALDILLGS